jgi:SAM-dependent methyltransferase
MQKPPLAPQDRTPVRALSFDSVAEQYDTGRPGYPAALFDAIEEASGVALDGPRVVDVGAGTGIATRSLVQRGARPVAVEPGPGMAARLHQVLPDVPLVRAIGDALPLAGATADLITYAQSWHWTDRARAHREAMRVLRPGGALALFWNVSDQDVPWIAAQDARLAAHGGDGAHGIHSAREEGPLLPPGTARTERRVSWTRTVPLDVHLANLGSHSVFRVLGDEATAAFLDAERAALTDVFPDGRIEEAYHVDLVVVTRSR